MQRRWLVSITTLLAALAAPVLADVSADDEPQDFSGVDVAPPKEDKKAKAPQREVNVEGIVGTMSEFDVKVVLEDRDADFDACHDRHRGGSGKILFLIHIKSNGSVGDVKAHASKVRNSDLIDCYTDVVSSSKFNPPHGGYADVKWTTKVGRSRKKKGSDLFGTDRPHRFDAPATTTTTTASDRPEKKKRHHRHRSSRKHHKS
ncbi:MAG TPA: hypothetical protein VFX59_19085 [Polyangiales bacterium]|nr:hypothetical protein [Polyangiales bacterium]